MTPPFTRDDHDKALIIHMSDTHISALGVNPARPNPHYNARVAVDIACERIAQSGLRPDLICVTGDICDAEIGERAREAYLYVRERIGALGRCLACPVVFAMGNHDERAAFRSELLSAEKDDKRGLQITLRTEEPSDSVDYMMMVPTVEGNLRVIVLDTSVPGQDTGTVSEEQCAWMRALLSWHIGVGTVLIMHHPPLAPWQEQARLWQMDPWAAARLSEVIRGSDVRAILCGHVHLASMATFAGVPVSIAGAYSRNQNPLYARELTYSWATNYGVNLVLLREVPYDTNQVLITPAIVGPSSQQE